jgi:hypothetical protein
MPMRTNTWFVKIVLTCTEDETSISPAFPVIVHAAWTMQATLNRSVVEKIHCKRRRSLGSDFICRTILRGIATRRTSAMMPAMESVVGMLTATKVSEGLTSNADVWDRRVKFTHREQAFLTPNVFSMLAVPNEEKYAKTHR